MAKYKITLTVRPDLVERIKIRAIKERRSVSEITETLWAAHLETELPAEKR
jgi:hypothetical protein